MTPRRYRRVPDGKEPPEPTPVPGELGRLVRLDLSRDPPPAYRPEPGDRWGGWYFSRVNSLVLDEGQPGRFFYEVDLDHITGPADVLDVLGQVGKKGWATREIVLDLLRALDCTVGGLQAFAWRERTARKAEAR